MQLVAKAWNKHYYKNNVLVNWTEPSLKQVSLTFVVPLPGTLDGVLVVDAGDVEDVDGGVVVRDPEHLT